MYTVEALAQMSGKEIDNLFIAGKICFSDVIAANKLKMRLAEEEANRKFEKLHKENRRKMEQSSKDVEQKFEKACKDNLEAFKKDIAIRSEQLEAARKRVEKSYDEVIKLHNEELENIKEERKILAEAIKSKKQELEFLNRMIEVNDIDKIEVQPYIILQQLLNLQ